MLIRLFLILIVMEWCSGQCLDVSGRWITAADLGAKIPEFLKLDPAAHILAAPWFRSRRVLSSRDLVRLGLQHDIHLANSPSEVCFEASGEPIAKSQVEMAVAQALASIRGDEAVEVTIVDFSPKRVLHGDLILGHAGLMSACSAGPCNKYKWRGTIKGVDGQNLMFMVELRLEIMETAAIARRQFAFGERIGLNGYLLAERRIAWRPGRTKTRIDPIGKVARRTIREGEVISKENLRLSRDVEAGETVELQVRSGELVLVTQAIAVTGGKQGDRVIVRNISTKKNFAAVVTGPSKAETAAPVAQGDLD